MLERADDEYGQVRVVDGSGAGEAELAKEVWEDESPAGAMGRRTRIDRDSLGPVEVPANRYWGPQTQRSIRFFSTGPMMPKEVHQSYGLIKKACARTNSRAGLLAPWKADAICRAADEVASGQLDAHFPVRVYQTGSGTHTNANVNEVIANRGNELCGGVLGSYQPLHPNDDVNMSQSSNDTFITAMHVVAYRATCSTLVPAALRLAKELDRKATEWAHIAKLGRTHLMDATPLTVGQEWSGYAAALHHVTGHVRHCAHELLEVALGGTAVGTGLNTPDDFARDAVAELARETGLELRPASNPFAAQSGLAAMAEAHAAVKGMATVLFKVANDIRWSASGPRAGLNELRVPANEPGSSIMAGKVNPTQAEALLMGCLQVMGHDLTISAAAAEGNFELNVFRPIVIHDYLESVTTLAGLCDGFAQHLVKGSKLNLEQLDKNVATSVMLGAALVPAIGYDRSAELVRHAMDKDLTLRDAAVDMGIDGQTFDRLVSPVLGP